MASSRARRIIKELDEVMSDVDSGVTLKILNESDISHLRGTFQGPPGTPYAGGIFEVDIKIPQDYPFKPPIMKFDTKVYHPNISSQTGAICLDILKDAWTPILTIKSSMISLQSLLQSPEPNSPQDAQVANHYISDLAGFKKTAAQWTAMYAQPKEASHSINPQVITPFVDMGFPQEKVIQVLQNLGIKDFSSDNRAAEENRIMEALLSL